MIDSKVLRANVTWAQDITWTQDKSEPLREGCSLRPSIIYIALLGVSSLLIGGCGGTPPLNEAASVERPVESNPLGALLTQAHSALTNLEDPSPEAGAVVRFMILTQKSLSKSNETGLYTYFNQQLKAQLKTHKLPKRNKLVLKLHRGSTFLQTTYY